MCGFVGVFNKNLNSIDIHTLTKMRDIIKHRGLDDQGIYLDYNLGFGFRRLSIIDLEQGHQPMTTADGRFTIAFNGEIYNYLELREQLLHKGMKFKTHSDTEVILQLYIHYGPKCLSMLNGMFAIAIWDREKRELFVARDRIGIKPFYYYNDRGRFIFASEIKAIIADRSIVRDPNYPAIADYISFMYVPDDKTFFKGIYKLLPGHYAIVSEKKELEITEYWDLEFRYADKSEEQFAEELRSLIDDALRIHLRSDVPVGCHLSGGLDSSTITELSAKHLGYQIKTFSGKFDEAEFYDETKYAKIVSRHANTDYLETTPSKGFFQRVIPKLVWHMDEPAVGPGIIPQYAVCQLAAANVKVALGGQGGDEIFGGYSRYFLTYEPFASGSMKTSFIGRILKKLSYVKSYAQQHGVRRTITKILNTAQKETTSPSLSFEERWKKYSTSMGIDNPMISDQFRTLLGEYDPGDTFLTYLRKDVTDDHFDRMLYHDIKAYLPGLLHVEDRMSMAVSLESRVPLLDHRIVEFAATIPSSIKVAGLEPKHIFKKSISGIIPTEVLNRKDKKGFPTPINIWFNEDKQFIRDILLDDRAKARGLFDSDQLNKAIQGDTDNSWQLWSLLNIELWFRIFIDEDPRYVNSDGSINVWDERDE